MTERTINPSSKTGFVAKSRMKTLGRNSATLHLVQSTRFARRMAKLLLVGLVISIIAMAFLPWQQTSRGTGSVVAYAPQERQQSVQAPTKGVVVRIGEGLVEGSVVRKGDFIVEIQPFAANMVQQLEGQLTELRTKEETAIVKADAYGQNVAGFTEALDFTVTAASQMVEAAEAKLQGKQRLLTGYEAKVLQAKLNYERQQSLMQDGLKPAREIEKLKKEWDVTRSELQSVLQDVESLKKELSAKSSMLEEKRLIAQTKIDYARAMQQDALGNAATIRKDIRDVEIKLAEMSRLVVRAPRDGTIFRLPIYELGQTIKAGDSILTLVPDTTQNAVELKINGNDMPLVETGQEVRLQFEGWPAVQFAGWPSVAIGTFSGQVTTVDATDDGKGQFRIMVTPIEGEPWPTDRYLRQGVRANGWVMLRKVSLGYEIWRQLNGFPVIVSDVEPKSKEEKSKPPKMAK
ncbi:HlyD family secretion protein [Mariniblastus fucicola]|uniref:Type I secretion system membrane fusion protein PrsE n=1 Tax=Mariniblastus fucicola TaxID=980251 RepID=A0A5B9PKW3_9BACT|nr:HlyD family efflux transporter periplasmic adaptor subunit [Mariniblastus fucicola]QEG23043.1 Type I secretion system membrane fusion protein PrsE [Mariniblastus fucicola]